MCDSWLWSIFTSIKIKETFKCRYIVVAVYADGIFREISHYSFRVQYSFYVAALLLLIMAKYTRHMRYERLWLASELLFVQYLTNFSQIHSCRANKRQWNVIILKDNDSKLFTSNMLRGWGLISVIRAIVRELTTDTFHCVIQQWKIQTMYLLCHRSIKSDQTPISTVRSNGIACNN